MHFQKRPLLLFPFALVGLSLGFAALNRHVSALPNTNEVHAIMASVADVANPANPGITDIQTPELGGYKRMFALSDVHGMYAEITHLLLASGVIEMVSVPETLDGKPTGKSRWSVGWHGNDTLLIVTGDSIDKGPQSLEVLKLWSDLAQSGQKSNNKIVVLLGNHEAEYLTDPLAKKAIRVHEELIGQGYRPDDLARPDFVTHDGYALGKFMRNLPVAARVGQWVFCHAGWMPDPAAIDPAQKTPAGKWSAFVTLAKTTLQGGHYTGFVNRSAADGDEASADSGSTLSSLLEKSTSKKKWKNELAERESRISEYGLYGMVFGHQPKAFGIEDAIGHPAPDDFHLIKIDSGMAVPGAPKKDAPADTWPQPNMGHLLLFPTPAQLASGGVVPTMQSLGFGKTLVTTPPAAP